MPDLEPDGLIRFPSVTVLKASAGSGKTYALTERYAQFLLSSRVPKNDLRNVLAITFSNNASREMRESVLEWLKMTHLRHPERLAALAAVTEGGEERTARKAGELIEEILTRYSDFQVNTIDSFMSTVFRASALDFGYSPDFEIVMDAGPLIDYAFTLFLREAREGSPPAALLDETIRTVLGFKGGEDAFQWDPSSPLLDEVKKIESKLSAREERVSFVELGPRMRQLEERISESLEHVAGIVDASGLEESARSAFREALASARDGKFSDLVGRSMKRGPVKKPGPRDAGAQVLHDEIRAAWEETVFLVGEYAGCRARAYYQPYLRLHAALSATVEKVKRGQGRVFIGDINRTLGEYLTQDIIPEIYFRIGDRVWHFLVDEFQDTSPLQWRNLYPLVENSLAMGGSLFVVGDTKQAIYGFRHADYTIMKSLETTTPFPSAGLSVRELPVNWRSRPRVVEFVSEVFCANASASPEYRDAARRSGLDAWTQKPRAGDDPGYVEMHILERNDEDPPERVKIQQILKDLKRRGYGWGDVALLASRNDQVVTATSWLNEMSIPFVSFSSLDVRSRKIAGEMLALLGFLDSPPDDLAFATFLLGNIFARTLTQRHGWTDTTRLHEFLFRGRNERPLYKAFQREYAALWKDCFAGLFRSAGYLPLYDLVSEAYVVFDVFAMAREEEATLAKLLETVKDFEGSGTNSLREFLGQAGGDGGEWAIDVPRGAESVRAMTVHKAKGLGFPVVIVLLYGESNRGFEHTLVREGSEVSLVRLTRSVADRDPSLRALYEEEVAKEKVNRLNGLYVSLTRAKREMYVIGVKRDRDTFPFDILPAAGFQASAQKGAPVFEAAPPESGPPLSHEARPVPAPFATGRLGRRERRRGERVHRMLELVEYAGADMREILKAAAARTAQETREDPAELADAAEALVRVLRATELGKLFTPAPGRLVLREQEFCDEAGRLFRMDRVVVDADRVTVVDFKTGAEEAGRYEEDMRTYARILRQVYPERKVEALLAYVDAGSVRRVL